MDLLSRYFQVWWLTANKLKKSHHTSLIFPFNGRTPGHQAQGVTQDTGRPSDLLASQAGQSTLMAGKPQPLQGAELPKIMVFMEVLFDGAKCFCYVSVFC